MLYETFHALKDYAASHPETLSQLTEDEFKQNFRQEKTFRKPGLSEETGSKNFPLSANISSKNCCLECV